MNLKGSFMHRPIMVGKNFLRQSSHMNDLRTATDRYNCYYPSQYFESIYDEYAGGLYKIILDHIPEPELADSILGDTFRYAFSHFNEYDSSKNRLFTWMSNILQTQINLYIKW
jgi:hypothetical protein